MPTYTNIGSNVNLTALVGAINDRFEAVRSMERGTTEPGVIVEGQFWVYDTGSSRALRLRRGGAWTDWADLNFSQLNSGGTVAMAASLNLGTQKIINLADGTSSNHAATVGQVTSLLNSAATADRSMGGYKITSLGAGTATGHAARVDDCWQNSHAAFVQISTVAFFDGSAGYNECSGGRTVNVGSASTFCPRLLRLRLAGDITPVGGGGSIGTLSGRGTELTLNRWPDDTAGGWIEYARVLTASNECAVEINWKNDTGSGTGRGFFIRLRRISGGALFKPATAYAVGVNGAGFN